MTLYRKILATIVFFTPFFGSVNAHADVMETCEQNDSCISCPRNYCGSSYIFADLLYWRAFESGLDVCYPTSTCEGMTSDGRVISKFNGKGRDPHFEWDPGFRVGAGYEFYCSNWDVLAAWTHFHSHAHSETGCRNKVDWHLDFDAIDLLAGYRLDLSSCFILRPFIGLRGAKIKQKLNIGESGYSSSCYDTKSFAGSKSGSKQKFWGVGPTIGLAGNWDLICDFSLYGNVSVSWLYGRFKVNLCESNDDSAGYDYSNIKNRLDASVAAADAAIGIQWQQCICRNIDLIFRLGLEHHRYLDFNRMRGCGDLNFDGVHFSVGLAF